MPKKNKKQSELSLIKPVSMNSLEIAQATGKEHKNVLRDIREMLIELYGQKGGLNFEHTYINQQNKQEYPIFILPKFEVEVLITGYSIELRAKVIKRLHELEEENRLLKDKLIEQEKQRIIARDQARLHNPEMNKALHDARLEDGKETIGKDYSNEANMINRIVLGMNSAQYRDKYSILEEDSIRDHMPKELVKAIDELQIRNKIYIEDKLDYHTRKEKLTNYYNLKLKTKLIGN